MPVKIEGDNDTWFESEPRTRVGMIQEMQRIRRRTRVRPWPVIVLAVLMTVGITYRMATRKQMFHAEVVVALREGSMIDPDKTTGLPLGELKELVKTVLLPDNRLAEVIERHNLVPLRKRLGIKYAIGELRGNIEVEVWRNSFVYYDPENPNREASARIGLTVGDNDPDRASEIAHDLAEILIDEVKAHRLELTKKVSADVATYRATLESQMAAFEQERSERMVMQAKAKKDGKDSLAQALGLRLYQIDDQQKRIEKTLSDINKSQEGLAAQISEAGLDLITEIVGEKRPMRPDNKGLIIAMIAVVVAVGSLVGCALVLGAFDSRVHDVEDVARLGLPVLGHVPDFPGSGIGSLEARGVQRTRTPLFRRWRSR